MIVKDIIEMWLRENDYSGLYDDEVPCGCEIEDLIPCDSESCLTCKPGYKVSCTDKCKHEEGPGDWHISNKKPSKG